MTERSIHIYVLVSMTYLFVCLITMCTTSIACVL